MYQIEIIGMRKKRDLKIVITIIILAIICIIACLAVMFFQKHNDTKTVVETNIVNTQAQNGQENNVSEEQNEEKAFDTKKFINEIDNIYNGEEGKRVFLTFDDGPSAEVTPHILDILKEYNIKATFFVVGNRVNVYSDIVKRAYDEGHYIGNHGYSHKYSNIYKSVDSVIDEYNKTEEIIRKALGNPNYSSHLFRFPGGSHGGPYEKIKKEI